MHVHHPAPSAEERTDQVDLALERLEVGGDRLVAVDHRGVAAAEPAQRVAERDVHVERQRSAGFIAGQCMAPVIVPGEGLLELQRGRIGRVTRPAPPIALDQRLVEADGMRIDVIHERNRRRSNPEAQSVLTTNGRGIAPGAESGCGSAR